MSLTDRDKEMLKAMIDATQLGALFVPAWAYGRHDRQRGAPWRAFLCRALNRCLVWGKETISLE
jgi:hypothetical protein